ncbi:unnamed protein product [Symbiodinium natans]|uniref:Uncharacterized protein n=1 Tax=Symbiodinium natans TaxID=878477 RepID=A0A812QN89_9DINO|nr:unnamed protein product [Symbiodinium natans]
MAPAEYASDISCRPDREIRLQKLLASAGYGGPQLPDSSAQQNAWICEPEPAASKTLTEATPTHVEMEPPKTKASPRRQPRQFGARPPRPETASRKLAGVGDEVDAADCVDDPPEAPPELSQRTQELLESASFPSAPAVADSPTAPTEERRENAGVLYDSDEELPCAPPEEASQGKEDCLPEVEWSLELMEASVFSAGSTSSLSLSDSLGRRPNMPKAPVEGEGDLSPLLAPGEAFAREELSAFFASSMASEGMASSLPEAPEEDWGCTKPTAKGAEVSGISKTAPTKKESPRADCRAAKRQTTTAAPQGRSGQVTSTFQPPLAIVGGGLSAATTRRPASAGRTKPLASAKVRANGATLSRSKERTSVRKQCNCRFCPSCRRRLDEENVRQAIARSLEAVSGESSQEPPIASANASRARDDTVRHPAPTAQPLRPRSSSANRKPVVRITASSSTERLRGHTKCSQARAEACSRSGGWRLRS